MESTTNFRRSVLVVDDEKLIVKGIRFSLEQEGMEVDCAYDGQEALDLALANHYDMILLDVMLPKINGFKISRLLKFDAKYKNIPILMVTARSQDADKLIGEETGADEYITKPFQISEILEKVKKYLG